MPFRTNNKREASEQRGNPHVLRWKPWKVLAIAYASVQAAPILGPDAFRKRGEPYVVALRFYGPTGHIEKKSTTSGFQEVR